MAKTKKRWIVGTKRDSTSNIFTEYVSTPDDSLSAQVLPYDTTTSIYEAINHIVVGITGALGSTGLQGVTGPFYGPPGSQGETGIQGNTGSQGQTGIRGQTGVGSIGATGIQGQTGLGLQGVTGLLGSTGILGNTGAIGFTGLQGATGIRGLTGAGIQGATGLKGPTGVQGVTGTALQAFAFNPVSRYEVVGTAGEEVWVVSSSTVYSGVTWIRYGTDLTLYRDSHGHSAGNRVVVRNTNKDYQNALIDSTTLDSFKITTTATDGTQGNAGAYNLGFTFSHIGFPKSGGTLYAPTGSNADCQLLSMRIRTGGRAGTTYDLVVPADIINGAGGDTSLSDCYMPDFNVRTDTDNLSAVAATMVTNISGSYSTFEFGNLGSISRFILAHF